MEHDHNHDHEQIDKRFPQPLFCTVIHNASSFRSKFALLVTHPELNQGDHQQHQNQHHATGRAVTHLKDLEGVGVHELEQRHMG